MSTEREQVVEDLMAMFGMETPAPTPAQPIAPERRRRLAFEAWVKTNGRCLCQDAIKQAWMAGARHERTMMEAGQ
jgi:hypothetical protein